jgi:hypothetical protein
MKYLLLCCFPFLFLSACDDDDQYKYIVVLNSDEDYLIFGHYGFECLGSCITVYKLQAGQLFADNLEYGFPEPDDFQTTPLSAADFQVAQVLSNEFPEELSPRRRCRWCRACSGSG